MAIVGAGPAGASAAIKASNEGVKVVLIDKKKEIGKPVQCGEYMPSEGEIKRLIPETSHLNNFIKLTRRFSVNKCKKIRFVSPSGSIFEFDFEACVIDRSKFDKELVSMAVANGCDVWTKCRAIGVDLSKNKLIVRKNERIIYVLFKVLIAADGAFSLISRNLGLEITRLEDRSPVIQSYMSGLNLEQNVCEMYWGSSYSPGGFAWIIPKGRDRANVGLGTRIGFRKGGISMRDYLRRLIEAHPIASKKLLRGKTRSIIGGVVPVGGPIPKTQYKNVLVVGDAAGQVLAHVGGGVPTAMIAGEIAGEVVSSHILNGTSLEGYERLWRREIGKSLGKSLLLRKIGDLFIKSDRLVDMALKIVGSEGLARLIRCDVPKSLELAVNKALTTKKLMEKLKQIFSAVK